MNTKAQNALQLRKTLVALVSVVLLTAAGPVYSVAGSDEVRVHARATPAAGSQAVERVHGSALSNRAFRAAALHPDR